MIANTLAIILNQAGFEARAVYSGEKAIEALDSFQPDMLISDVIMTGMTGIEAAIATREKMPNCKILLFSGQAATADLLEKARAGRARVRDSGEARASDRSAGQAAGLVARQFQKRHSGSWGSRSGSESEVDVWVKGGCALLLFQTA